MPAQMFLNLPLKQETNKNYTNTTFSHENGFQLNITHAKKITMNEEDVDSLLSNDVVSLLPNVLKKQKNNVKFISLILLPISVFICLCCTNLMQKQQKE